MDGKTKEGHGLKLQVLILCLQESPKNVMVSAPWSNLFGSAWVKKPSNDLSTELTKNSNILVT